MITSETTECGWPATFDSKQGVWTNAPFSVASSNPPTKRTHQRRKAAYLVVWASEVAGADVSGVVGGAGAERRRLAARHAAS